jgi:hypothetical protein
MASSKMIFEYAVIRIVPVVEREEFINVGVVLFCKELDFLAVKIAVNEDKLNSLAPQIDKKLVSDYLSSFQMIVEGQNSGGEISEYLPAERFRWLTATRSAILQCSKIHPGFCANPDLKLNQLFSDYVE